MTSENLFEIPVPLIIDETNKNDSTKITLDKGEAIYIVGANGSGKTRLARYIEQYIIQNYGEYKT
ncbi:MAG: ATP-binding cassette domain-containing protein, partial [Commensalibacter sp.]|nr:ATP-binding cassette domain-containing protein [Commensalibacter sp.]